MKFYLDGSDWEADYFISDFDYAAWTTNGRRLHNMYLDNASAAGFIREENPMAAQFKATVPGCDRSVLVENNAIADPYYGRNLDHSRWSEKMSWAFRKKFTLPEEMRNKKRFQLHFCGIDYQAKFLLNGVYLYEHTGMFIPFEADVTDCIRREGENNLVVIFDPVPQAMPDHQDATPEGCKPAQFANYHRAQMSYGWDWMRGMVAAGIWDHVYLNANDDARITDCFFRSQASGDVELTVDTIAQKKAAFELQIDIEPANFSGRSYHFTRELNLVHGDNSTQMHLECPAPELWYPRNYGKQNLYRLTLTLDGEETVKTVAFRTLEMRRNPNSPDRAYDQTFTFNGQAVFARGVNWIPADLMHSNCGAAEYERQVRLAAENNTNIFRVWGGGIIEKEEFYDACDRYGVIVWQEFPHCCSCYRSDPEFVAFKAREGEAILRKLRNHVSVAMICGGNEMMYYGEYPENPIYVQYRKLTEKFAPDLPYHVASPDRSRPGERNHGPWHFMMHEQINPHDRLVASELGCNGFPEYESVKKFIPEYELETPDSQSWKYHFAVPCRNQDWHVQMPWFNVTNTPERCQATMFVQSDILGYWMNHCRRKYPHTTGCFFWQYNEPWPTLFLSVIDYYTLPKMAYYRLGRVQKNTILSLQDDSWSCADGQFAAKLYLTSDLPTGELTGSFRLLTGDGKELLQRSFTGVYGSGSVLLDELNAALPDDVPGGLLIAELRIKNAAGEIIFEDDLLYGVPDFKNIFTAPACALTAEAVCSKSTGNENLLRVTLRNSADAFAALQVRLNLPEIDHKQVYWRDNYVTVAPGCEKVVTAALTGSLPEVVELTGWNMQNVKVAIATDK
ncbi:MAG: hypothetical protein E7047_03455 [Lentisphaerae bacterium]|nr:hypothetical protein [Lentisphaerota bacterium]